MRNALVHDYLNLDPERIVEVLRTGKYRALLTFCDQFLAR
ncbi:MAG: HepT-like ribonuclease domain-containing protein [Chromatocurvus sp.]